MLGWSNFAISEISNPDGSDLRETILMARLALLRWQVACITCPTPPCPKLRSKLYALPTGFSNLRTRCLRQIIAIMRLRTSLRRCFGMTLESVVPAWECIMEMRKECSVALEAIIIHIQAARNAAYNRSKKWTIQKRKGFSFPWPIRSVCYFMKKSPLLVNALHFAHEFSLLPFQLFDLTPQVHAHLRGENWETHLFGFLVDNVFQWIRQCTSRIDPSYKPLNSSCKLQSPLPSL